MRSLFNVLVLSAAALSVALATAAAQESDEHREDRDMMKKLEEVLREDGSESDAESGEEDTLEKANRSLHGGSNDPSDRKRKKPLKLLKEIIDEMDAASRSLEENTREMNRIKQLLEKLRSENTSADQQRKIRQKIKKLFRQSKDQQQSASGRLKEIVSLKKKFRSAKSAQQNSMVNLEKLIRMASKSSSSKSRGSGKKKKKKKKKGKKPKQQTRKPNKNQPARKPYEASSTPPDDVKLHSGKASDWGNLPPKVRDAIMQRKNEEFVPGYGDRLRNYYKKLGSETEKE